MLAYLDALIAALSSRDTAETERLLAHPLSRILPEAARVEAEAFGRRECDPLAAPLRVLQLRLQTAELLREAPANADLERSPVADRDVGAEAVPPMRARAPTRTRRSARLVQMELPLPA